MAEGIVIRRDRHNQQVEHQLQLYKTTKVQVESDPRCYTDENMHYMNMSRMFCESVELWKNTLLLT